MSARTFLNALRRDDRRLPEPEPGRWKPYPNFLVDYGADIAVEGRLEDRRGLANVPTVFARPIYFAQALADDRHPAHRAVRGQWRGLLAVFALQRWLGLPLGTDQVVIPEKPTEAPAGARALWTILRSQLPRPEEEWARWWLLRCDDRLIGATSPWTIVYTPTEYDCPQRIPWQTDGLLIDPLEHYDRMGTGGRSVELSLLAIWLDRVLQARATRFGIDGRGHLDEHLEVVTRQLAQWRSDLMRYRLQEHADKQLEAPTVQIKEAPYSAFLRALDIQPKQDDSDLLIESRRGKVIVLARQGLEPSSRVYGPSLLNDVDLGALRGPVVNEGWKTKSQRAIPLPCMLAEEAFFPRRLACIRASKAAWSPTSEPYALPLTSRFFDYFTPQDLQEGRIKLSVEVEEGRIIARLRLPLSGRELTIEKVFDRATEVIGQPDETPALAVWPDFFDPAWRHNFALMAGPTNGATLNVAPFTSGESALPASRQDGNEKSLRVWPTALPVLGFVLSTAGRGAEEAGVVLRRSFEGPLEPNGLDWRVAVDFGTSNSHVRVKEEEKGATESLTLGGRTTLLTEPSSRDHRVAVAKHFYPEESAALPVPTLLYRDDATIHGERFAVRKRLLSRFHYVPDKQEIQGIVSEVKWARDPGTREEMPLRAYLQVSPPSSLARHGLVGSRSSTSPGRTRCR